MVFAPHPDDESLACSIPLQRAARAEAAVSVVYIETVMTICGRNVCWNANGA
jgi:GlcNAc-PI de-N-acetylase